MSSRDPSVVILLAEHDADVRRQYACVLRHDGHHVFESADGLDALAIVTAQLPDLIICSPMLPGLSGLALCRVLRDSPDTRDIPFIAIVTGREVGTLTALLRAEATHVLRGPVWPDVLARRVRAAVQAVSLDQAREIRLRLPDVRAVAREQRARTFELRDRARALMREILSQDQGVVLANGHGDALEANDAALAMTGYNREELMAKPIWTVMTVAESADPQQAWIDIVSGIGQQRTVALVRKDGRHIAVHTAFTPNVMPCVHAATLVSLH